MRKAAAKKIDLVRKTVCPKCNQERFTRSPQCLCLSCFTRWTLDWQLTPEEFWSFNSSPKSQRVIADKADELGVPAKALNVLFNTQWDLDGREGGWIAFSEIPAADRDYATSAGVLQDSFEIDHATIVSRVVAARERLDRRTVAAAFASSLLTRRLSRRSTLGSYAHALHLADHPFQTEVNRTICRECEFPETRKVAVNHFTFRRVMWAGNVYQGDLGYVLCDLNAFNAADVDCGKSERALLKKLWTAMRKLPASAGLAELRDSLTGLFPSNQSERQVALEILGCCGILKPANLPSLHSQWVPKCDWPEPTHFYSKEWRRPVSSWTGADGLNDDAIDFWFGDM